MEASPGRVHTHCSRVMLIPRVHRNTETKRQERTATQGRCVVGELLLDTSELGKKTLSLALVDSHREACSPTVLKLAYG